MDGTCIRYQTVTKSKAFEHILYFTLLCSSLVFVTTMFQEYLDGASYIKISQAPITKDDIPVATICLSSNRKMKYGKDYKIQVQNVQVNQLNSSFLSLLEGQNNYQYNDSRTIFLKELTVSDQEYLRKQSCLSMNMKLNAEKWAPFLGTPRFGVFIIDLSEEMRNSSTNNPTLYLTTQENSYGVVSNRWWNGRAEPFEITGGFRNIQINSIQKYENLPGTCSHDSFAQCAGSKIRKKHQCLENGLTCAPVSLPRQNTINNYPICQSKKILMDCTNYLWSQLEHCLGKKPCYVQEYNLQENKQWSGKDKESLSKIMDTYFNGTDINWTQDKRTYMFSISLGIPRWSRGRYTVELMKDVYREHLVWSLTSIIGNIGGYLGLCVGFSFNGFIAWGLGMIPKLCSTSNPNAGANF